MYIIRRKKKTEKGKQIIYHFKKLKLYLSGDMIAAIEIDLIDKPT